MATPSTSCGVLLLNPQRELLLCHATGAPHWDIPKGLGEPGETPLQSALRETLEETSLRLHADALLDLGLMAYRPGKQLHLFAGWAERFELDALECTSVFRDPRGRLVPEADAFEWTPFERIAQRCAMRMRRVLLETLSLEALWQRVATRPPSAE